ncbi:ABC transporter permease subunit [Myxococcota bacterium]|nr:ABC transporter permease subunit [Myxococcota bacterium]
MSAAVLRIEARGVARARWFTAAWVLAAALVGFFVVVGSRESAVVGFTGLGRVMGGVVQASLLFLPLLALLSTTQAASAARQQGVLEWYLAHPLSRARVFWGLFLPRLGAVLLPVAGSVAVLAAVAWGLGQPVGVALLGEFLLLLLGQGFCFAALGMAVGVTARAPEQALLLGLSLWAACAALVDFVLLGLLLRWDLPPQAVFGIAVANPIQAGRVGMLAGLDPQLGVLGPVGTWATITLGAPATVAYGLAWPFAVGGAALLGARRRFLKGDLL